MKISFIPAVFLSNYKDYPTWLLKIAQIKLSQSVQIIEKIYKYVVFW